MASIESAPLTRLLLGNESRLDLGLGMSRAGDFLNLEHIYDVFLTI